MNFFYPIIVTLLLLGLVKFILLAKWKVIYVVTSLEEQKKHYICVVASDQVKYVCY